MTKYLALCAIPEPAFEMAIDRIERLNKLNPDVTLCPMLGPRQLVYLPMIYDQFIFGSNTAKIPVFSKISHISNWLFLSIPGAFHVSWGINKKVTLTAKNDLITRATKRIKQKGLPPLYIDYTPMALWNLDHSILHWFNHEGKNHDFDYMIFYEADIYTTKPLAQIYDKYVQKYDAAFSDLEESNKYWAFYDFPPGSRRSTLKWLKKRSLPTTIYKSIFAGALISRRCLNELTRQNIDFSGSPFGQNEMRLPTILNALGFKCGRLEFPFVRYRPEWSINEIETNKESGIFHPVKKKMPPETNHSL
jgi:hypothetical protein